MKIRVGVSNRHIHLCKHDADILFGSDYVFQKRNDLSQEGEYACMETVRVWTDKGEFPHVRVMGPLREYTQVEVSEDDARVLGINPPMRNSGMLQDSESVWIGGPKGEKFIKNCCIKANRHIHCNTSDNIGHNNRDIVQVKTSDGKIMDNVHIKMGDNFTKEMHIDKSDALLYGLENGDYIELD